ncbi:aldehyde dehydrogenase family protein [Actinomadura madurae]|uniref:aldehyde dehydrogenase family protein n=1 Tax=Actinomadura madurae TaxID=1993 RepID=UPI002026C89A|nr:aldehyde dehydrogenase family protein [Actinomadura madurae]URN03208.1 aldehyde dehydrogenase family protein [Actinomadura madurae]
MTETTFAVESGAPLRAIDPRTGAGDATYDAASTDDVSRAARKARSAQKRWEALGLDGRRTALLAWADAIEASAATIAEAEMRDTGRRRMAHEVPHIVAGSIRAWCGRAPRVVEAAALEGVSTVDPGVSFRTQLVPYPLVGIISPWNHPFLLSTLDLVPALLAGSAAIVKPSEITPRFIEPVRSTLARVPELEDVVTYLYGDGGTGRALIDVVDVLCFTGSVATGRKVAVACAERFVPVFLELGGKDAAIVTRTADLERATEAVLKGAVHNTGQICFATERVYVQRPVIEEFVDLLVAKARALKVNHPDIRHGHLGPFIDQRQAVVVDRHLGDAVGKGARILTGGTSTDLDGGRYLEPTVVVGVDHSMSLMTEETFGPVIPVMPYDTEDEAVALANDSDYGLSAAVIAGDADEAERIARRVDAGAISLQDTSLTITIMGDVEKTSFNRSGLGGSRMGPNALLRFFRKKALIRRDGPVTGMTSLGEDGLV